MSLFNSLPLGLQTSETYSPCFSSSRKLISPPPPAPRGRNTACLCTIVIWFIIVSDSPILYSLDIFTNRGGVYKNTLTIILAGYQLIMQLTCQSKLQTTAYINGNCNFSGLSDIAQKHPSFVGKPRAVAIDITAYKCTQDKLFTENIRHVIFSPPFCPDSLLIGEF